MTNGSEHAFPHLQLFPSGNMKLEGGLTKREYIAALVMAVFSGNDPNAGRMLCDREPLSKIACDRADDLLKRLAKQERGTE